jgi:Uma2 family endonuclease
MRPSADCKEGAAHDTDPAERTRRAARLQVCAPAARLTFRGFRNRGDRTTGARPERIARIAPARYGADRYGQFTDPIRLMALTVENAPVEQQPRAPYWTLDDYHQAIDAGVFGDRRIELINGTLYEMPPMRERHIGATRHLSARFYTLGEKRVLSQMPIILPDNGEPEPDMAVVDADAPLKPSVQHVQLVIEVSYATRQFDRGVKLEAYLAAGLREVWIVDLVERCALVYRNSVLAGRFAAGEHARLTAELVPDVTIDLDALFQAAGLSPA